jgi:hypothetical protein
MADRADPAEQRRGGARAKARAVLARRLAGRPLAAPGVTGLVDAVTAQGRLYAAFARGTLRGAFAADGGPGAALPLELREVGGACLAVLDAAGPPAIALAGGGILALDPDAADWAPLAGRDVLLAFRLDESPAQIAAWLDWHAGRHGASGALILDRTGGLAAPLAALWRDGRLAVVVAESPLPLGLPGLGPENHPLHAPDAPGRARMEVPPADPWRAPLGEPLVLEALKWRFLGAARTVLTLDPSDYLAPRPPGTPTAFAACAAARRGVIPLVGRRIYPWRVRAGQEARLADHICRPFDLARVVGRWGVAPAAAGLDVTWRASRVAYSRPDAGRAQAFLRAMAIRVPGRAAGELAPKSSLVEDPALVALAAELGWKPVRPPVSAPRAAAPAAAGGGRTAIVTTMKNEAPFILDWLAWHRAIGVTDFLIYTNDCSDGTDALLALLAARGIVQHRDNPYRAMQLKPQHAALQAAEAEPLLQACDWAICMDVDEYLNIKIGDGRLPALYAAMEAALPGANMISATWRLFGNSGVHAYEDRPVFEQFTRCAPELIRKPHQAWGFKTLFRNIAIYRKLGVHRPKGLNPDLWGEVRWLNGSGRPLPREMFRNGWRSTLATYGYDWVQLNHYAVRSAESFLVKRDRGRVNHVDRDQGLNYWFRMNMNAAEDRSILARRPLFAAERARLVADPAIAAAHAAGVAAHRAKIAELRARPEQAAFYAELTSPRMERLCALQAHFGANVFKAGPGAVPADLDLDALPPGFFFTVEHAGEAAH